MKQLKETTRLLIVVLLLGLTSCQGYLDLDPPNDKLQTSSVFTDSLSASLALTGMYSSLVYSTPGVVSSINQYTSLNADELDYSLPSDDLLQFSNNNLQAGNANINSLWVAIYKGIYQVNSIIEGTDQSTSISVTAKKSIVGEAKFIRAFLYFYAVNLWGDVPLILHTDYKANQSTPRTEATIIYDQILADLTEARSVAANYPGNEKARPNKLAITALLARVNLYLKQWDEAAQMATEVIESRQYRLTALEDVFLKESDEIIFQLFPAALSTYYNSYDGFNFIPSSLVNNTIPVYFLQPGLVNAFEINDQRKVKWMGTKPADGITYYFPYKYKVQFDAERREYNVVLRLAEQYLIRAEARAHQQDIPGAAADLNTLRARARGDVAGALPDVPGTASETEIFLAIARERRSEMFTEWGDRWFDTHRTGEADTRWPIPLNQLLLNPHLVQNAGY